MPHLISLEAENLLDKPFYVLDKGEVILIDYLGNDVRVVDAARVCYGTGTKTIREDLALIAYLIENHHTSPLEQVVLTFRLKLPLAIAAQIVRHRTARLNAESFRFSEVTDEFYIPTHMRNQSATNKQGSSEADFEGLEGFTDGDGQRLIADATRIAMEQYEQLRRGGVAREMARFIIPQNLYTNWYWQIDLHNLMHFLRLRLDWHAQAEVRVYAEAMAHCARAVAPVCYTAFEEYVLNAVTLSASEVTALRELLAEQVPAARHRLQEYGGRHLQGDRRINAFPRKLIGV